MTLLDGKACASAITDRLKEKIVKSDKKPGLAFILVGHDAPSQVYVSLKEKKCHEIGIVSFVHRMEEDVSLEELKALITKCNQDPNIDGILLQQPLPKHLPLDDLIELIKPCKDVDGFHPVNMGKVLLGLDSGHIPCTPLGIVTLLEEAKVTLADKHVVIAGRSNIVGKPLAALLLQKKEHLNATVTVVHSKTKQIKEQLLKGDVVIIAIGHEHFLTNDMVKDGAIVIDVGINKCDDGTLTGDVDFDAVSPKAKMITPVPGGIGPMTIAMLLSNTYNAFLKR